MRYFYFIIVINTELKLMYEDSTHDTKKKGRNYIVTV